METECDRKETAALILGGKRTGKGRPRQAKDNALDGGQFGVCR